MFIKNHSMMLGLNAMYEMEKLHNVLHYCVHTEVFNKSQPIYNTKSTNG